jgi:isopentenyldiphosphate isomerase
VEQGVLHNAATTDPGERLEVFDATGEPTGVAKARAAVHRDGDWHLAFFCWIVRGAGVIEVLLQRRAPTKDVWPGRFDASAAGHVRFGETTAEAAREIEEELGLHVDVAELEPLGRRLQEHVHASGLVDREIHDVHLLRCDRPLEEYRPGPEVSGIASVPLDALIGLVAGDRASLATTLVTFDATGGALHEAIVLEGRDLVPYDVAYWQRIREAAYSGRASIARR